MISLTLWECNYQTIDIDLERWFAHAPQDPVWNVISDYGIGDENKANDVFFFIVMNHDTVANISRYIAAVAPRDIKLSGSVGDGILS